MSELSDRSANAWLVVGSGGGQITTAVSDKGILWATQGTAGRHVVQTQLSHLSGQRLIEVLSDIVAANVNGTVVVGGSRGWRRVVDRAAGGERAWTVIADLLGSRHDVGYRANSENCDVGV